MSTGKDNDPKIRKLNATNGNEDRNITELINQIF